MNACAHGIPAQRESSRFLIMVLFQRRGMVRSLVTVIILLAVLVILCKNTSVMTMIMPSLARYSTLSNDTNSGSITIDIGLNCILSTNSTILPANCNMPSTNTDSTSSTIAGSSIDLYQAWVKKFTSSSMGLPLPHLLVTPETIFETQWAPELWRHLSELDTKYVSLCIGNSAYIESIVNWLIAALVITQPPLDNVLVISLDTELHEFLQEHDINSVYVDINSTFRKESGNRFWLTRLVLFRLINHWGYTVATYDSDAIPVKNPQTLFAKFEDSNVVGSRGVHPPRLSKKWKSATMCMGMTLFKASKPTEEFWNFLSALTLKNIDDQYIINTAFDKCGIKWNKKQSSIIGRCSNGVNLTVSLVSSIEICRSCNDKKRQYFVWHQLAEKKQKSKKEYAIKARVWFLKKNYDHTIDLKGLEWLQFLNSAS